MYWYEWAISKWSEKSFEGLFTRYFPELSTTSGGLNQQVELSLYCII